MSKFESIFNSNTEVDPNLNNLFSKKVSKKSKKSDIEGASTEDGRINQGEKSENKESINANKLSKTSNKKIKQITPETEKRTIFIGNLPKDTKKEDMLKIFKSYGKIESVRFRNIVPEDITKSKKYAFITKQTHPNKHTINAFVRFTEEDEAKKAADEVNGMEFKSNHLRVDIANRSKVHDNKKSVFLGGLPFDVTDEDVYSHFSKCGPIQFVRIIRDNKTGIGKGFGYVQFNTADTIALALRLDGSSLQDRKIRVSRCVKKQKTEKQSQGNQVSQNSKKGTQNKKENKFQTRSDKVISKKKEQKNADPSSGVKKYQKDRIPRNEGSNINKSKKRKFQKKKHISTNKKDQVKFKI